LANALSETGQLMLTTRLRQMQSDLEAVSGHYLRGTGYYRRRLGVARKAWSTTWAQETNRTLTAEEWLTIMLEALNAHR
jgi:hypothetical protein